MLSVEPSVFKNAIGIKKEELLKEDRAGFVFAAPTGMISSKKIIQNIDFKRSASLDFLEQQKQWLQQ
ncbi:MAG: isochorismate synthase, partial [Acinetobacter sp.]|nr:isochorismate synthase [Acinetobacter sp.]